MIRQGVLVFALAAALAGCNTSYNYFEAESEEPDPGPTTLVGTLMKGAGLVPNRQSALVTRPRAPLAMPGSTQLPSPDETQNAESNVNFPVDDDDARRERQRRLAELGADSAYEARINDGGNYRVEGANAGGASSTERQAAEANSRQETRTGRPNRGHFRLSRAELRETITGRGDRDIMLTEDGQAQPRRSLLQPPTEYRTPSESAALPEKKEIEHSKWLRDRLYKKDDGDPARLIKE